MGKCTGVEAQLYGDGKKWVIRRAKQQLSGGDDMWKAQQKGNNKPLELRQNARPKVAEKSEGFNFRESGVRNLSLHKI